MVGVDDAVLKQLEGKMQCLAEGVSGTYYCFVIEEVVRLPIASVVQ